ncbi:MAG: FecR domain-containing protein [Planctomycetaceae bacterium]
MNAKEFTNRWGQHTAGTDLTVEEVLAMESLLEADAVLRAEVAEDHQIHRMLNAMGAIHESQDDFVNGVIAACSGVDNPFAPFADQPIVASRRWRQVLVVSVCVIAVPMIGWFGNLIYRKLDQAESQASLAMRTATEATHQIEAIRQVEDEDRGPSGRSETELTAATTKDIAEPEESEPAFVDRPVAVVIGDEPRGLWRGNVVEQKLGVGEHELISGTAILRMAGGSILSMQGPIRFSLHHSNHVFLHEGNIEVQVSAEDIGFRISTTNARVIDLGTTFQVLVDETGRTRVRLDAGEVVVVPWNTTRAAPRRYLRVGEYQEAVVLTSGNAIDGVFATYVSGPSGFEGSIRLGETSLKLTSIDRFDYVVKGVTQSFQANPARTNAAWLSARLIFARVSGEVTIDGEVHAFDDVDSLLKLEQTLSQPIKNDATVAGAITIAGKEHRFKSLQEYLEFRERVFEPLQMLGVPILSGSLSVADESNPFER